MIEIHIKLNENEIVDAINTKNFTLNEVALIIYRLEQIKTELLQIPFEEVKVRKDD